MKKQEFERTFMFWCAFPDLGTLWGYPQKTWFVNINREKGNNVIVMIYLEHYIFKSSLMEFILNLICSLIEFILNLISNQYIATQSMIFISYFDCHFYLIYHYYFKTLSTCPFMPFNQLNDQYWIEEYLKQNVSYCCIYLVFQSQYKIRALTPP